MCRVGETAKRVYSRKAAARTRGRAQKNFAGNAKSLELSAVKIKCTSTIF